MKFEEYLQCAKKHLVGVKSILDTYTSDEANDINVWLELYYLSGYILEGIVVYSTYKLYGWPESEDIKARYNFKFTSETGLDFYNERHQANGIPIFPNKSFHPLSVQSHHFQAIVDRLLKIDPTFKDVPYLGDEAIDSDVEELIKRWLPNVRYLYVNQSSTLPLLNKDIIQRLIDTCNKIYLKHI